MALVQDHEWPREEADVLKAVWNGKGDEAMQRRALIYLVEIICGINQTGFDPENMNMTAFHAGRKWVARQLQNAITLPLDQLTGELHDRRNSGSDGHGREAIRAAAGKRRTAGRRGPVVAD